jgi:hypothetical protein
VESDLPKGYRGGAGRSSNVGVPASPGTPSMESGLRKGFRGGARRSSKVGVPGFPPSVQAMWVSRSSQSAGVSAAVQAKWVSPELRAVIKAAEIRAPDTARDHVVPGGGVERDEGGAGLGHAGLLPWNLICPKTTAAAPSVQAMWVSQRSSVEGDEGGSRLGHAGLLPWNLGCEKATAAGVGVQARWVSRSSRRLLCRWKRLRVDGGQLVFVHSVENHVSKCGRKLHYTIIETA